MDQHILWGQGLQSPLSLFPKLSTSLQIKSWCLAAAIVALKVSLRIVGDLHNGIMEGLGVRKRTDTVRTELNSRLNRSTHPAAAELPFRSAKNFSETQTCSKQNSLPIRTQTFNLPELRFPTGKKQHCCFSQRAMQLNGDFCCSDVSPVKNVKSNLSDSVRSLQSKIYLSIRIQKFQKPNDQSYASQINRIKCNGFYFTTFQDKPGHEFLFYE